MKVVKFVLIFSILFFEIQTLDAVDVTTQTQPNAQAAAGNNGQQNQSPNGTNNPTNQNNLATTNPEECKKRKIEVITMRLAIVEYSVGCILIANNKMVPNSPPTLSKEEFIKAIGTFLSTASIEQLTAIRDELDKSIEKGVLKFTELGDFSYSNNSLSFTPKNINNGGQAPAAPIQAAAPPLPKKNKKLRKTELSIKSSEVPQANTVANPDENLQQNGIQTQQAGIQISTQQTVIPFQQTSIN